MVYGPYMALYEYVGDVGESGIRLRAEGSGEEIVVEIENRDFFTFDWHSSYRVEVPDAST